MQCSTIFRPSAPSINLCPSPLPHLHPPAVVHSRHTCQTHTALQPCKKLQTQTQRPCATVSSSSSSSNSSYSNGNSTSGNAMDVLGNTRPVDRLRYQAKFVFTALDTERKGRLQGGQVQQYLAYSDARFGPRSSALDTYYKDAGLLDPGKTLGFEQFVDVVRNQVRILSDNSQLLNANIQGPELGKLLYNCCITTREMTQALVAFKLMDLDNDGFIPAEDLAKTQSVERKMVDDVLDDAEEDPAKRANFSAYVQSYARERPVALTMVIMATHTLAFWLLFSAPIDVTWKVLLSVFLLLKPQLINSPLIRAYQIIRTLFGRSQAELDMRLKPS
uniref:EF-hand domain-containing protein n=1 Tax=Dunaliella tertiolecta TaxID=3047 RepID=A0A7S3VLN0_DUNTE